MKNFTYLLAIAFLFSGTVFSQGLTSVTSNPEGSMSCTTPTLTITSPEPICEGDSATLTATSNGEDVHWYNSATGGTPIHTGTTFTTPSLSATTSYWAQAVSYGDLVQTEITGGARVAPTNTSSAAVVAATSPWGLSFDAHEDFTINSVDVYLASASPGNLEMQLLDSNWNVLQTTTVACPAGGVPAVQFEVPLDFAVEAGNTYRLVAASSPTMIREFSGSHDGYPYPIGNAGTVTGGTINNSHSNETVYYFFYNWTITAMDHEVCASDMVEAAVTVNPIPDAPTGDATQTFHQGQTLADLEVVATGDLTWYEDENGTVSLPETTPLVDQTTYYVSQTVEGCESDLFAITVTLALGVNNYVNYPTHVYPNPFTDILNIKSEKDIDWIELFDVTGRRLATFDKVVDGKIDLSGYAMGTYVIKIKAGKELQTIKIIKK